MQVPLQIKEFDSETGVFEGYANTFDHKDHAGDITQKGAFTKSLARHKASGSMPALLWQHDMKSPIGVWEEMREDANGLYAKGRLTLGVQKADEALLLMKAGALKGLSIGYHVNDEEWSTEQKATLLNEVDLLETSLVTFPCNDQSNVERVKSLTKNSEIPTERDLERALKELGLSNKQSRAFISEGYKGIKSETQLNHKLDELLNVLS